MNKTVMVAGFALVGLHFASSNEGARIRNDLSGGSAQGVMWGTGEADHPAFLQFVGLGAIVLILGFVADAAPNAAKPILAVYGALFGLWLMHRLDTFQNWSNKFGVAPVKGPATTTAKAAKTG